MLLIKNVNIFLKDGQILENHDLLIQDGKIKEIEKEISLIDDVKVLNGEGKNLYPGLIDAHSHVGIMEVGIGWEGNDTNEMLNPITPEVRAIDGIYPDDVGIKEARQGGVTSVCVAPGSANVIGGQTLVYKTVGNNIDKMTVLEGNAMKAATGENPKRVYQNDKIRTRMRTAALLRETLFKTQEYLSKKEAAQDDPSKLPPYNMSYEAMIPVVKKEIPLKIHAHRADDILTAIRIAKEFDLKLTLDHCTEGHLIANDIAESGFPALVGPTLTSASKYELRNKTFDTPKILHEAGTKIAIITDSPVIPQEYLGLCAGLAHKAGLDEIEAIKAITINPAEILGVDDRIGSIEVGKDADLVLTDGSILSSETNVLHTIINGEIVYSK